MTIEDELRQAIADAKISEALALAEQAKRIKAEKETGFYKITAIIAGSAAAVELLIIIFKR